MLRFDEQAGQRVQGDSVVTEPVGVRGGCRPPRRARSRVGVGARCGLFVWLCESQRLAGHDGVSRSRASSPSKTFCLPSWPFVRGVVPLALQGGPELDGGLEERARFADGFEVTVQPDRAGPVAVAEHAAVHLGPEFAHSGAFGVGGQFAGRVVEGFDLFGDGEVLVGDGAVGDAGVDHGHPQGSMPEKGGNRFEGHAPVDRLGGQGVPKPVRVDVADPGGLGGFGDGAVDAALPDALAVLDEQVRAAQAGWPVGDPVVEELFELGVQRDVSVGAQLAQWHVQPVGGADLHDRVGGKAGAVQIMAAGSGDARGTVGHRRSPGNRSHGVPSLEGSGRRATRRYAMMPPTSCDVRVEAAPELRRAAN